MSRSQVAGSGEAAPVWHHGVHLREPVRRGLGRMQSNLAQRSGAVAVVGEIKARRDRRVKAEPGVSPGRGRGLFAVVHVETGETIDEACTIAVDAEHCPLLDRVKPLNDYYFEHPECAQSALLVIGMPSLCNHSDRPNAKVRFENRGALGWMAILYALADIVPGEEIFFDYNYPLWFETAG